MKRLLKLMLAGQSLRHRPVALWPDEQRPVRAVLASPGDSADITARLFPVSLNPLVLGIHSPGELGLGADARVAVRMFDADERVPVGDLRLRGERILPWPGGDVLLLKPTGSRVRCAPALDRAWRYALAWRQAKVIAKTPNAFAMSFPDLKALNVFYMMPRPVYLVSVAHGDASNIFPMDLVGPVGDDTFLLALRRTSPSIELMKASGRIVVSAIPAELKEPVYALGMHHKQKSIDWAGLPIATAPSPAFGIPAPVDALSVRELEVRQAAEVGSHVFFDTRVAAFDRRRDGAQLCHVSDMYARWRAARGRSFAGA
ncbi:MAG TPA: flavin reductase [Longimicrobiaceae bacterium]|nr:flavin reductase [Longimicrobiaceae bacterium]